MLILILFIHFVNTVQIKKLPRDSYSHDEASNSATLLTIFLLVLLSSIVLLDSQLTVVKSIINFFNGKYSSGGDHEGRR